MFEYIAALDQGTTSTRFLIFDRTGRVCGSAQREHQQHCPRPGWVEHDPNEIWTRSIEVMAQGLQAARVRARDIAAIGITNQRETTLVWERRSGQPVSNAIVWQDMRVSAEVELFAAQHGPDVFRERTGLPLSTYFSSFKLRWMLENIPGLRQRALAGEVLFGTVDTFLIWHLTGGPKGGRHLTDVTNASRTQLMNLHTLDWDDEILGTLDIPRAILPEIRSSSEVFGRVQVGPLQGVPLAADLGDQHAALFGQTCFARGEAKNTYGTGCFLLMNSGETPLPSSHGLLTTVAYRLGNAPARYALEGSIAVTGAAVQWLRDRMNMIRSSAEIESLARSVPDNGGVYFVPAFAGLFAPYWDRGARGTISGLTGFAERGHLARATLEAAAFQTRDVLEAMEKDCGQRLQVLGVDGGMVENELLMQFQADILGRPVQRPLVNETTSLGAAYAAGLAVGYYYEVEELRRNHVIARQWRPSLPEADKERLYAGWQRAVRAART